MFLKVLHYNVQFLYKFIVEQNNNYRPKIIAEYVGNLKNNIDVISFCETFDSEAREILIKNLYKFGFKYSTPVLDDDTSFFSNGGIFLMSKFPIISYSFYIYRNSTGIDYFANKGIVRITLKKENKNITIFSTHLQAWKKYTDTRNEQIKEFRDYIKKSSFSSDDIVILIGDFNMSSEDVIHGMKYDFDAPKIISTQKYTFDSTINSFVGIDGSEPNFYDRVEKNEGKISFSSVIQRYNLDHIF